MKPHHRFMLGALKNALIFIAAFALYEIIEQLKVIWKTRYPESVDMHGRYGQLMHLFSVFMVDLVIGGIMYYVFNFIH